MISSSTSGSKLQNNALPIEDKKLNWLIPLLFEKTVGPGRLILDFLLEDLQGVGSLAGINRKARQFIIDAKIDKQALLQKSIDAVTQETPQERVRSLFIALVRSPLELMPFPKIEVEKSIQQRSANMGSLLGLIRPRFYYPRDYPISHNWIAERLKEVAPGPAPNQIHHLCNYLIKLEYICDWPRPICELLEEFEPCAKDEVREVLNKYLESVVQKGMTIDGDRQIHIRLDDWVESAAFPGAIIDSVEAIFLQRIRALYRENVDLPLKVSLSIKKNEGREYSKDKEYSKSLADKIAKQEYGDLLVIEMNQKEERAPLIFDSWTLASEQLERVTTYYTISLNPLNSASASSGKDFPREESKN